ncbi:copper fist DNA binding domain-containing protein [Lactarius hatsudake]|nr:copper fist DNA binding domain-containing protein [Lactarius hatsudake]
MVLISDKKYACEACIKGHRSSACKHTDRPLFEIKKKGRPITQCEHCRELRKTKQVHVKCMCEAKDHILDKEPAPTRKKARVCRCKDGVDCHCPTAKKPGRPKTRDPGAFPPVSPTSATSASVPLSIHALRPVLPRPPLQQSCSDLAHPHNHRFSHGSAFFSPYGRAYEEHHYSSEDGHTDGFAENCLATHRSSDLMAWSSDSSGHSIPQKTYPPSFPELRDGLDSPEYPAGYRGFCTCGETCACQTLLTTAACVLPTLLLILLRHLRPLPKMGGYRTNLNH